MGPDTSESSEAPPAIPSPYRFNTSPRGHLRFTPGSSGLSRDWQPSIEDAHLADGRSRRSLRGDGSGVELAIGLRQRRQGRHASARRLGTRGNVRTSRSTVLFGGGRLTLWLGLAADALHIHWNFRLAWSDSPGGPRNGHVA